MTRPTVDRIASRLPRSETWVDDAPCRGQWWLTDLPSWLGPSTPRRTIISAMMPALRLCAGCPFVDACRERTAPTESWFDGVCAGVVYRNGRAIGGLVEAAERAA